MRVSHRWVDPCLFYELVDDREMRASASWVRPSRFSASACAGVMVMGDSSAMPGRRAMARSATAPRLLRSRRHGRRRVLPRNGRRLRSSWLRRVRLGLVRSGGGGSRFLHRFEPLGSDRNRVSTAAFGRRQRRRPDRGAAGGRRARLLLFARLEPGDVHLDGGPTFLVARRAGTARRRLRAHHERIPAARATGQQLSNDRQQRPYRFMT
jgi:hypothetical protein